MLAKRKNALGCLLELGCDSVVTPLPVPTLQHEASQARHIAIVLVGVNEALLVVLTCTLVAICEGHWEWAAAST